MAKGLSYLDAVRLLGGAGPLARAADNLLGGALSLATAGGSDAALSLFDAKTEMVRLGTLVTTKIHDAVRGLGRYNRSRRLEAAHAVLVVAAFFEVLDECLADPAGLSRDDQLRLAATPAALAGAGWIDRLTSGDIPAPDAGRSYATLLTELTAWYVLLADRVAAHLTGLLVWDRAAGSGLGDRLPRLAADRFDETHRRLAEQIPEFAIWAGRLEDRAAAHGLERLEELLLRSASGRDPGRHRATLAHAYRAALDSPILGGDPGLPTLGAAYLDPRFTAKPGGPGARPADERWWDDGEVRTDLGDFLATYLTTTPAAEAPLLLLGQPGAGKSSLTRVLAARLPAGDFFVARVPLREVPAEAEIQDQVELAVRAEIGETVAWAELARDAGDALPVILLDGFDELLQATGLHQSDYLERVARFQEREARLGRPVAVVVTSRVAVADRARLPAGGLVVRLEPFSPAQITQWLTMWNTSRPSRPPLTADRLPDLAEQPLLLLMLALYHAAGHPLDDDFDRGRLYERLLSSFADREVRRVHEGRPETEMPALVEAELLRLSVVAFAMFHRNRLWVTERELDDDLAGLGLAPSRPAATRPLRTPVTAGQEMVGRFLFIQRSQAMSDDKTLQAYEFLHATFGEYLVARLTVQSIRDTAARSAAGTPGPAPDRLHELLGYMPLSARGTILPFVTGLITPVERPSLRGWLVARARQAVTRPQYPPLSYQPFDKRVDHWMATYSFNLVLLVLACGNSLRASELHTMARDPADWLRGSALQWRAAVPGAMWLEAVDRITVRRDWHEGRRDMVLSPGPSSDYRLDMNWSNRKPPGEERDTSFIAGFELPAALPSMHMSNNLSDDAMLHAIEPLLARLPAALTTFVTDPEGRTESVAHVLTRMWVTSTFAADADDLTTLYQQAAAAVNNLVWPSSSLGFRLLFRCLRTDLNRVDHAWVVTLLSNLVETDHPDTAHPGTAHPGTDLADIVEVLLAIDESRAPARQTTLDEFLSRGMHEIDATLLARAVRALLNSRQADGRPPAELTNLYPSLTPAATHPALPAADPELAALLQQPTPPPPAT